MVITSGRRSVTTTSSMGKRGWPCFVCGKASKVLYRGPNGQWTCSECTPEDDQFIEEVTEDDAGKAAA